RRARAMPGQHAGPPHRVILGRKMLASLPMYDLPEVAAATAAWWQGLARAFRAEGLADVPGRLATAPALPGHWRDPALLFSQTCGFPLTHGLAGALRLVATPCYRAAGCDGARYRSFLVVAGDSPTRSI